MIEVAQTITKDNVKKLRFLKHEEKNITKDMENLRIAMEKEKTMIKRVMRETTKPKSASKAPKCGQCDNNDATVVRVGW